MHLTRMLKLRKRICNLNFLYSRCFSSESVFISRQIHWYETSNFTVKFNYMQIYFTDLISFCPKVLENIDNLFEGEVGFKSITNAEDGSMDFSLFMISPDQDMWNSLCHNENG